MTDGLANSYFDFAGPGAYMSLQRFWDSIKKRYGDEFSYTQVKEFYHSLEANETHQLSKRGKLFRHFLFHGLNVRHDGGGGEPATMLLLAEKRRYRRHVFRV
jgi:hypothetical protein